MADQELTIERMKPGILVAELCQLKGGVHYVRSDIDSFMDDQYLRRKYQAEVTIQNVAERNEGDKIRSMARFKLRQLCAETPVGLICPRSDREKLNKLLLELQAEIDSFNKRAKTCRVVSCYALFAVEEDNQGTIAAISAQVADVARRVEESIALSDNLALQGASKKALCGLTPKEVLAIQDTPKREAIIARARAEKIRAAISEMKGLSSLLPDNASLEVGNLVARSRAIARQLCKEVEKKGTSLQDALQAVDSSGISKARLAFVSAAAKATAAAKAESKEERMNVGTQDSSN